MRASGRGLDAWINARHPATRRLWFAKRIALFRLPMYAMQLSATGATQLLALAGCETLQQEFNDQ
jgi:hypothetical protein